MSMSLVLQKFIGLNQKKRDDRSLCKKIAMKVKYIGKKDTMAFKRDKIYEVMSIERHWYRIMTELDEDYFFPPNLFEIVENDEEHSN